MKACFLRWEYLFQLSDDEIGPMSPYFTRRWIFTDSEVDDCRLKLVKMKHLHFKKVGLRSSLLSPSLLTSSFCSLLFLIEFIFNH